MVRRKQNSTHTSRFSPKMEQLERREVFATSISIDGSILNVTGDNSSNDVEIVDNGNGDLTVVADGLTTSANNITRINLNMRGGSDNVLYTQNGNRSRSMDLNASLGSGSDVFRANINGNVNWNRTLDIGVHGDSGNDNIRVDADNDVDVRAGGNLRVSLDGDWGNDRIRMDHRGEVDGRIRVRAEGDLGDDNVRARVTADRFSSGRVESSYVRGDSGNDRLDFQVRELRAADPFAVDAVIDGGNDFFFLPGNDIGFHTTNVQSQGLEQDFIV